MKEKIYTLLWERHDIERSTSGTLEEIKQYFSYTLLCGHSWNRKIKRKEDIKSINALIKAINASIDETHGEYDRPYVSLKR